MSAQSTCSHEHLAVPGLLPSIRAVFTAARLSAPDADDLTQATCLKALAKASQFKPSGDQADQLSVAKQFRAWVFAIARRILIDFWRARLSSPCSSAVDFAAIPSGGLGLVAEVDERLSPDHRRILECLELGISQRETASCLGLSEPTVSRRMGEIRSSLRPLFPEWQDAQ